MWCYLACLTHLTRCFTLICFALFIAVRMAYGLPYGMASRNFALCTFIVAFLHVSLGKSRIYRYYKVSISVTLISLWETGKKEEIVRGSSKEKQKLQVFNSYETTESPPSLLYRDCRDWYHARYFCAAFLCSSYGKNQIESFSDVAIGSLSHFLESLKRIPA